MSDYQAIICPITNIRDHCHADRLKIGTASGHQVVVGLDTVEGTLGIFFQEGGQLSYEMSHYNNLHRHIDLNISNTKAGFFEDNRRVRAQIFRKEMSTGFWTELSALEWTEADLSKLKRGDLIDTLNGHDICNKYFTPATMKAINRRNNKLSKRAPAKASYPQFYEHWKTSQLRLMANMIPVGSVCSITEKAHGCVAGDTIVDTLEYGKVRISHVVNNIPNIDIHIMGLDIQTGKLKFSLVSDRYLKKNHGKWYKITTEDGTVLEITGNNPVWLPELKCYRRVDKLKEGDVVFVDR